MKSKSIVLGLTLLGLIGCGVERPLPNNLDTSSESDAAGDTTTVKSAVTAAAGTNALPSCQQVDTLSGNYTYWVTMNNGTSFSNTISFHLICVYNYNDFTMTGPWWAGPIPAGTTGFWNGSAGTIRFDFRDVAGNRWLTNPTCVHPAGRITQWGCTNFEGINPSGGVVTGTMTMNKQ